MVTPKGVLDWTVFGSAVCFGPGLAWASYRVSLLAIRASRAAVRALRATTDGRRA